MTNPETLLAVGRSLEKRYGEDAVGEAICRCLESGINLVAELDIRKWLKVVCWRLERDDRRNKNKQEALLKTQAGRTFRRVPQPLPQAFVAPDVYAEVSERVTPAMAEWAIKHLREAP